MYHEHMLYSTLYSRYVGMYVSTLEYLLYSILELTSTLCTYNAHASGPGPLGLQSLTIDEHGSLSQTAVEYVCIYV